MKFTDCIEIVGSKPTLYEGTKQYVSTGAVEKYFINKNSIEEYTYNERPSRADLVGKSGDILFAKMAETKKTLILDKETENYLFSTGFFAIRPKSGILTTKCLYYLLNSKNFLSQKDKNSSGATQKAITNSGLEKINVNIPLFSKQDHIVKQFDLLTDIIKKYQSQLEKLDFLIKSRFIEMFGDPTTNPMNWEIKPMGELLSLLTDFSSNGSYKTLDSNVIMYNEPNYALMIRTTDLESGDFSNNVKWVDEKAYNLLSKSKVFGKEIIMNKIGSAGKVYLMPELNRPVTLGRNAFLFRYKESVNSVYIYFLLTSEYGKNEIKPYIRGAVTKTITKDDARKIRIPVPPITLQNNFENFVQQIDKSKFENTTQEIAA